MLEIARICCRIERSLQRVQRAHQEHHLAMHVEAVCTQQLASRHREGCRRMRIVPLLQLQLASSSDQRRHCDQRHRPARPAYLRCEWCTATAHATLQTTRPNIDVRRRRRAHEQSTGAAEPRRAKNFAFVTVQAVSFLASGATLRGC